ncbi:DUF1127 domain-containing protein [Bradyrhizobium sp. WYCCWR 13023]|uniref:DUF1127 domain-containing protein n=1 Tax=Bradyrhizobium zhengyangense TaxID=2911009 RepID=A0A9X1RFL4_9BRAD|nr:DUF1127 domain-containing protein [Bradyrhizobium zhengyangense]MCG2631061.1 DUF1127 domain-containing protein [Bradyrhizobium zhengyangense]
MSTTYGATGRVRRLVFAWRVVSFLERYWDSFQERRKRERLCAVLANLSDAELMDIGIARGEIDYVATNRANDPRGAVCAQNRRVRPSKL